MKTAHAGRSGTCSPNSTKGPKPAVKWRIISLRSRIGWNIANEVLETVALDLRKPVTGLTGYDRWRAEIDRLAETARRIMDGQDTYATHLNGISLGVEHMRWALTDIGRLIARDDKQISEMAEQPAPPETDEEHQRRLRSEAHEFSRLQSAVYDARSEEDARAACKALDDYVERESKKRETPEEQERQTHNRSKGRGMSM